VILSPTLLYNAVYPISGTVWEPRSTPTAGLLCSHNRMDWLSWGKVERVQGEYDWTLADGWVDNNLKQGILPVANLCTVPSWHLEGDDKELERWWQVCYDTAVHFKGRVRLWEVGNEFDTAGHWMYGRARKLGEYWRVAHNVFTMVDPNSVVIAGNIQSHGPTGNGLRDFAEALQGFGGDGGPAAVSLHLYPGTYFKPSEVTRLIEQFRGVCIANGAPNADIYVTEFGLGDLYRLSKTKVLRFLDTMANQMSAADVKLALFWQFDDPNPDFGGYGFSKSQPAVEIWNQVAVKHN
jgi:hypothetical protein